jgi:hypothetical protein
MSNTQTPPYDAPATLDLAAMRRRRLRVRAICSAQPTQPFCKKKYDEKT